METIEDNNVQLFLHLHLHLLQLFFLKGDSKRSAFNIKRKKL